LRELDPLLRVARDLAGAEPVDPLGDLLPNLDPLEPVVVEPALETVDVLLRAVRPVLGSSVVT